jgi:hypothetical protein
MCEKCQENPKSHTFVPLGTSTDGVAYYYTNPGLSQIKSSAPDFMVYYKKHLDQARIGQWIWIFDCGQMQLADYASFSFVRELNRIFLDEHSEVLKKILVIHPNIWVKMTIGLLHRFFKNPLLPKIRILESASLANLILSLHAEGIQGDILQKLLRIVKG